MTQKRQQKAIRGWRRERAGRDSTNPVRLGKSAENRSRDDLEHVGIRASKLFQQGSWGRRRVGVGSFDQKRQKHADQLVVSSRRVCFDDASFQQTDFRSTNSQSTIASPFPPSVAHLQSLRTLLRSFNDFDLQTFLVQGDEGVEVMFVGWGGGGVLEGWEVG